ncbi:MULTISPECIES: hypothetical protein [Pseudomonas]|uniref:DUF3077 domain-containing protein n=1 Tax=Pseudomonas promysalinigenes TaxID=485898 RepID=A0ABY6ANJ7_9PSED|nr:MULTISPECIES: hypothetical protein [Pseudomonas]PZQ38987.1 MAG: hypothetical protein DI560_15300 [Pseudomonas putida]UXH41224.1 hypothetical protein N5C08_06700 [Pseudomonas promysalinigenes]
MTVLVTRLQRFTVSGVSYQVEAGAPCSVALAAAGSILSGVNILLGNLIDQADEQACELCAIRTLTMQVEAMIGSMEVPIRDSEDHAPHNQTTPVRGAEASQ